MIVSCYKQHFKVSVFVMVLMRLILVFMMMNILVIFQFWWSTKIFEMEKTWYISALPEWYNVKATSSLSVDVPLDLTNISVLKYFKSFVWRLIQYFWPRMPTQSIGAIFQCSMLTLPVWSSCWEGDISTNSKMFRQLESSRPLPAAPKKCMWAWIRSSSNVFFSFAENLTTPF